MTKTLLIACAVLLAALIAVIAAATARAAHARRKYKRELAETKQEAAENAQHTADIITQANSRKEDIQTGSGSTDFDNSVAILHELAGKRKS